MTNIHPRFESLMLDPLNQRQRHILLSWIINLSGRHKTKPPIWNNSPTVISWELKLKYQNTQIQVISTNITTLSKVIHAYIYYINIHHLIKC